MAKQQSGSGEKWQSGKAAEGQSGEKRPRRGRGKRAASSGAWRETGSRQEVDPPAGVSLPEGVVLRFGTMADLKKLAEFHYCPSDKLPANFVRRVLVAEERARPGEPVGVLVIARPLLNLLYRPVIWPVEFAGAISENKKAHGRAANLHVSRIARLIVRPEYRRLGLGEALVRAYLANPLTKYTEVQTRLNGAARLFARVGMRYVPTEPSVHHRALVKKLRGMRVLPGELSEPALAAELLKNPATRERLDRLLRAWVRDCGLKKSHGHWPLVELMAHAAGKLAGRLHTFVWPGEACGPVDSPPDFREACAGEWIDGACTPGPESKVESATRFGGGDGAEAGDASARWPPPFDMPGDADELHALLRREFGVSVPRVAVGEGSSAPFEYLVHAFFEGSGKGAERQSDKVERRGAAEEGTDGSGERQGSSAVNGQSSKEEGEGRDAHGGSAESFVLSSLRASVPSSSADCVVWAARGTGKTFLGAVATMLDMVFKPGVGVRILAGSIEQAQRMHQHLVRLFDHPKLAELIDGRITSRSIRLLNGSHASVLAASQTSVRGVRVQKLRCDEVDLFDESLWSAVQLTTRSLPIKGPWGGVVRPAVEALSTMHTPGGLMSAVVDSALAGGSAAVFRWNILDVLDTCGDEHVCERCALEPGCGGKIKRRDQQRNTVPSKSDRREDFDAPDAHTPGQASNDGPAGFVSIADALAMRARVDSRTWEGEMLCITPTSPRSVFAELDRERHVFEDTSPADRPGLALAGFTGAGLSGAGAQGHRIGGKWIVGLDFGRVVSAALLGHVDPLGVLRIVRERIAHKDHLAMQIEALLEWRRQLRRTRGGGGRGGSPCVGSAMDIAWVGADPSGNSTSIDAQRSLIKQVREAGFEVRPPRFKVEAGLAAVRARLEGDLMEADEGSGLDDDSGRSELDRTDGGAGARNGDERASNADGGVGAGTDAGVSDDDASGGSLGGSRLMTSGVIYGPPRLLISSQCPELFNALRSLRYKPRDVRQIGRPEILKNGSDHASDALRYMVTALDLMLPAELKRYC